MTFDQILALLGYALELVKTAESMMPESGKGADKLAFVEGALRTLFEKLGEGQAAFEQAWPRIQRLISLGVSVSNALGWFKRAG